MNGINLGYITEYEIKGYQYKNPNTGELEKDKINVNGIGKFIQGEDKNGENAMTNVLNVLIDHQKNTNLPNQLNELNRYLIELRKSNEYKDVTDKKKSIQDFDNDNHWINDVLQYNIIDIFNTAYDNYFNCRDILGKLSNLNNLNQNDKNKLINDIANNFIVQYNELPTNQFLKKGINLKDLVNQNNPTSPHIQYSLFVNRIRNIINNNNNNVNNINKLKSYINKGQSGYTLDRANKIINELNNINTGQAPTEYNYLEQRIFLENHQGIDSGALRLKELKDNYERNHPNIKMFDNVVCSDLSKKFYNFRNLTINFATRTRNPNNNIHNLFGKMVSGMAGSNIFHHIFTFNKNGKINGPSFERGHMIHTDRAFKLLNTISPLEMEVIFQEVK